MQIATRELARQAKRLAIKEKGIDPSRGAGAGGARKGGGRDGATPETGAVNAIFERVDSGDESGDDEARGSGSVGFLARYRALVRERDVGVLREREDREARAREEEEWRSSRSDDDDDDEDEGTRRKATGMGARGPSLRTRRTSRSSRSSRRRRRTSSRSLRGSRGRWPRKSGRRSQKCHKVNTAFGSSLR